MQSIKRLPRSVHGPLRSSIVLFDLPKVVEELIYNSIDAGATKVMTSIDLLIVLFLLPGLILSGED